MNNAPSAAPTPTPPNETLSKVAEERKKVHEERDKPIAEEETYNQAIYDDLLSMNKRLDEQRQKIEEERQHLRADLDRERQQMRAGIEDEQRRLRGATDEAERKLAEAHKRLAAMEQQEAWFAKEHAEHDARLKAGIMKNHDLTKQQLEIIQQIKQKIESLV